MQVQSDYDFGTDLVFLSERWRRWRKREKKEEEELTVRLFLLRCTEGLIKYRENLVSLEDVENKFEVFS